MSIRTMKQLTELIEIHEEWKPLEQRPFAFGLIRDFQASDFSMISLRQDKDGDIAFGWAGSDVENSHGIELKRGQLTKLLDMLCRKRPTEGDDPIGSKTTSKTWDSGYLITTVMTHGGKNYFVETLCLNMKSGRRWAHRAIGEGIYHEWGAFHDGDTESATRSHKEYVQSMKTVIARMPT